MKRKFVFAHMKAADVYADLSTCIRLKVGAVIVKNNTPIAIGYNGTKPGHDNCCEDEHGNTKHDVRHAEINALNKLWRSRETAEDGWMFQTHSPCPDCIEDLRNSGITHIFFKYEYRKTEGIRRALDLGLKIYRVWDSHIYQATRDFSNIGGYRFSLYEDEIIV